MTSTGYYGGVEGYILKFLFNQCFQLNWMITINNLQGVKVSTFLTFTIQTASYKQLVNLYRSVGQRYTLSQHVYAVFSLQLFDVHKYLTIPTISNLWTAARAPLYLFMLKNTRAKNLQYRKMLHRKQHESTQMVRLKNWMLWLL